MSENNRFNHIKVSPAEEEDVVIYAGAPTTESQDAPSGESHGAPHAGGKDIPSDYLDTALEDEVEDVSAFEGPTARDTRVPQEPSSDVPTHAARSNNDSYQETTLEDIEGSKMSVTQKVIIVIAVLAVIAFVVYSILFM